MSPRARYAAVAAALAAVAAGCASPGPQPDRALPNNPATLAAARSLDGVKLSDAAWPDTDWWRGFGDAQLDGLVTRALAGSPTLAIARARVARARAAAAAAEVALRPEATIGFESTLQRYSEAGLVPPPIGGSWRTQNRLALDASWDIDPWGRNRAAFEGALGQARAAEIEVFSARLALTTALVRAYVDFQRLSDQLDLARATLRQREGLLAITRARVDAGLDSAVELRLAEGAVPGARVDIAGLEESIALVRNQLAALAGEGPDAGLALARPKLQPGNAFALPVLLPADLLGRRPDLVAQRWRVEASGHDIDAARARFHPNVNLIGFLGFSGIGFADFISSAAAIAGIGPAIRLPIFEGGRLRADLAARQADYDLAVGQYNQTIVDALRDVTDQVVSFKALATRRADQAEALDRYRKAYDLAVLRYREGIGNQLAVLAAEAQVLLQQRIDADLRNRELDLAVGLVRALGGGYVPEPAASFPVPEPAASRP
jgi:NodT family efflux transporter outer membrane factor (OMF) lipoprotein